MSHLQLRSEKNCLNCGTIVADRYCSHCGQENVITKESFISLVKHFIFDLLHFDGNFFPTIKYLFSRPGFVPKQYIEGKRLSYLHPVRMYLFTSAVFFLVFQSQNFVSSEKEKSGNIPNAQRMALAKGYTDNLKEDPKDTSLNKWITLLRDTTKKLNYEDIPTRGSLTSNGVHYPSLIYYDSVQNSLPQDKRDGWIGRTLTRKQFILSARFHGDTKEEVTYLWEGFLHKMPYMLFISLPFFALILKLLYVRRKSFYYSDHAVFTLYHYIFSFILILGIYLLLFLKDNLHWPVGFLVIILTVIWPVYLFISMKKFYGQSGGKTFFKFLLLNIVASVLMPLVFLAFIILSIFEIH